MTATRHFSVPNGLRAGLAALAMSTLLAACGGGSSDPVSSPPAANTLGSAGGNVSTSDDKVKLGVAAGALRGDTAFAITPQGSPAAVPDGYAAIAGTAWQIVWTGAGFAGDSSVTLRIADTGTSPANAVRVHALRMQPLADPAPPTSAVVHCADGSSHIYVVQPDGSGYDSGSVILCDPVSTSGGTPTSTTNVVLVRPAAGQFPTISAQPANVSTTTGATATFSVTATAATTLGYQWQRDGVDIPGATASSYSLVVALGDSGATFAVRISNGFGSLSSASATLTVGPPPPPPTPLWSTPKDLSGFTSASDLPQVGVMALVPLVAWNDNGALASSFPNWQSGGIAMRGRPKVLAGPNLEMGYVVFIDDDGTSTCTTGWGNRLSAVAVGWSFDINNIPPSDRFTLYRSSGDCITTFAAAMGLDGAKNAAIVFALQEQTAAVLKVGTAAATQTRTTVNSATQVTWNTSTTGASELSATAACTHAALGTDDAMHGTLQANMTTPDFVSNTTLAWVGSDGASFNVCAATLVNGAWSQGAVVLDNAQYAEPIVAMDGAGNTLIAASRVIDPQATALAFAMTTAYRPAAGGAWQVQALDASDAPALPSAAFDATGNAFLLWRPSSASGTSTVYQTRRDAAGHWDAVQPISDPDAVETRYPRICVGGDAGGGQAVALFEENFSAGATFRVESRRWKNGVWSGIGTVQDNANEGRFADCPRNVSLDYLSIVWRETNPNDATQFRVMTSTLESN